MKKTGHHGTCSSYASNIEKNGFNFSRGGRIGAGVYFWEETEFSKLLAEDWYKSRKSDGYYNKSSECAVFFVEINYNNDDELLDLTNSDYDYLLKTVIQRLRDSGDRSVITSKQFISRAMITFIKVIEESRQIKIIIVRKRVAPPPGRYLKVFFGEPIALLVRDLNNIKIIKKEICHGI